MADHHHEPDARATEIAFAERVTGLIGRRPSMCSNAAYFADMLVGCIAANEAEAEIARPHLLGAIREACADVDATILRTRR